MLQLKERGFKVRTRVTSFAPATIANVSCGFDIFGFAVNSPGDKVSLKLIDSPGVIITKIHGDNGKLPLQANLNTAGVAAIEFLQKFKPEAGLEIEIFKQMPLGSGMGSSAASAAATLFGLNYMFDNIASEIQLIEFALKAEKVACGSAHADNVAPSLLGGFILIRSYDPLDIVRLHFPKDLFCVLLHSDIEIRTETARKILPEKIKLKDGIAQWGNVAGLVAGLFLEDYKLISRSLNDNIIEPVRSKLIPYFDEVKNKALKSGALGCSISGSGPSIFALCRGNEVAKKVATQMKNVYDAENIESKYYISPVNEQGPKILVE